MRVIVTWELAVYIGRNYFVTAERRAQRLDGGDFVEGESERGSDLPLAPLSLKTNVTGVHRVPPRAMLKPQALVPRMCATFLGNRNITDVG